MTPLPRATIFRRTRRHVVAPFESGRRAEGSQQRRAFVPITPIHLSYCTNIHPGETWDEVRGNLVRYLVPVRELFAPGQPFGVGLRLSAESAQALAEPEALEEL